MSLPCWGVAVVLLLPVGPKAQKQEAPQPEPPITVVLPTERKSMQRLAAAADYIAAKEWKGATMLLQSALDAPEGVYVLAKRRGADGKEELVRTSAHAEAERMIRALPADGRAHYRATFQQPAADFLKQQKTPDWSKHLNEVARRYLFTDAGAEALEALAVAELQIGHPKLARQLREQPPAAPDTESESVHLLRAALAFERLLELRGGPDALIQPLLFKAAVAFRSSGDRAQAERMWRVLTARIAREGMLIKPQR